MGTVLDFFAAPANAATPIPGAARRVVAIDRESGELQLDSPPAPAVTGLGTFEVRSREYQINVFLLRRPDPAVPSRNTTVLDEEQFVVTLDQAHSLYVHSVIGTTWMPAAEDDDDGNPLRLWDRRSEGGSRYIRVRDRAAGTPQSLAVRAGLDQPEEQLVNGTRRAARLPLAGGDDAVNTLNDDSYLGLDDAEPRLRTGIHALTNVRQISLVAVPGQITEGVQQALINHCELDRYRFALLDGPAPAGDSLQDVQQLRQRFDTKYAALYHPWLSILDPSPGNLASIAQVPIPPSGHMAGLYARIDNERGVHKAPANEVVRGITGLQRYLNEREHDILNPVNINVIRSFRETNRGIRAWGRAASPATPTSST